MNYTDEPIINKEEDKFGRAELAKQTAEYIKNFLKNNSKQDSSNYVMSVLGAWGEGKTSFINLVVQELKSKEFTIIRFAPWRFGGEKLYEHFFNLVNSKIKPKRMSIRNIVSTILILMVITDYVLGYGIIEFIRTWIMKNSTFLLLLIILFGITDIGYGFISEALSDIAKENVDSVKYLLNGYLTNTREIIRFLNIFKFEYFKSELNFLDIVSLTAIKSKEIKVYEELKNNKRILCSNRADDINSINILRKKLRTIASLKSQELMASLFPSTLDKLHKQEQIQNGNSMYLNSVLNDEEFSIKNAKYFDRYFHFRI